MEQFVRIRAIAAPIMRINIDTDQIIPARFLVRTSDDGIGEGLFADWRTGPDGKPRPDFILNQPPYDRAEILIADRNFGCGSSREGAPKALRDRGFRAVIAPSFGGIFFNNSFRNGLLPVVLPAEQVHALADAVQRTGGAQPVTVDLEKLAVTSPGGTEYGFGAPPRLRDMMLAGIDEVEYTLRQSERIEAFRSADRGRRPWAYRIAGAG
ncbi:MAG: 3-isopropylmalate dehydratase small subunit [Burkholderiales bacterium]|nr:MAG: 3-isopropylmalate dehydratase small subunit [Burkholderiales bacterium]